MRDIPYGRQFIDMADLAEVDDVLAGAWLTQGPAVQAFERALADYCGAKFAVAVSSGTAALHLACLAADLRPGDEAITTPLTFVATANAVLYCGARPFFADIDRDSMNISVSSVKNLHNAKTKVILPVHFAGLPADIQGIADISNGKSIIIEDACHALGAEYCIDGTWHRVGDCACSTMTVFSFHPVKHITTGEGGVITTNDEKLYRRLLALRSHGIYRDTATGANGPWVYDMRELGFNYRITDIQCALGLSQLRKIDKFLARRREIAAQYNQAFSLLGDTVKLPTFDNRTAKHAWHLYVIRLNTNKLRQHRLDIFNRLVDRQIKLQIHYLPVYRHSYYQSIGYEAFLPRAEEYYEGCLSLPIFYSLTEAEQSYVVKNVCEVIASYQ